MMFWFYTAIPFMAFATVGFLAGSAIASRCWAVTRSSDG